MENLKDIAQIYDEWILTLEPEEALWCEEAVRNVMLDLRNVGELGAKTLVVAVLLFYDGRQRRRNKKGQTGRPDLSVWSLSQRRTNLFYSKIESGEMK